VRSRHPDEPMYTFRDYKRDHWQRDGGLRIDFLWLNKRAAERLIDAGVDRFARRGRRQRSRAGVGNITAELTGDASGAEKGRLLWQGRIMWTSRDDAAGVGRAAVLVSTSHSRKPRRQL
jgi:hypothetical protein